MRMRAKTLFVPGILLCVLVFFISGTYLIRPLWFDEALTVQNFAVLESVERIYFNYVIPNNQLLYTMMLHWWIKFYNGTGSLEVWMRLLSIILGAATLFYTYRRFRVSMGTGVMAVILITFCCAPPFLLHATALRGYMAGTCFTMWLGDKITEQGIGNGLSLIIFVGIIATSAQSIVNAINNIQKNFPEVLEARCFNMLDGFEFEDDSFEIVLVEGDEEAPFFVLK